MIWIWAVLIAGFVVGEIAMPSLICIWFAGGAFVAMLLDLFNVTLMVQIIVFLSVSLVLLLATRPYARSRLDFKRQKTNLDAIVGKDAIVTEEIKGQEPGAVKIEGKVWTAKLDTASGQNGNVAGNTASGQNAAQATEARALAVGETVTIKEIRGVTLIVTEKENN